MSCAPPRHIIGHSPAITRLRALVARLRGHSGSVIVTGEPGAGKELVARGLREPQAPFVSVDAATIMASTAESLLFGHEKGAFTGAHTARAGLLEEADGGVLYIDEIANMSLDVQAKLLRALQEKEVTRLGASRPRALTFRVVCATNQDLESLCAAGAFRFDLYTRLSVFPIAVPALRERKEDIAALFAFFCRNFGPTLRIADAVQDRLTQYAWPGNVRELSNAAQYACVMVDGDVIRPAHLPDKVCAANAGLTDADPALVDTRASPGAKAPQDTSEAPALYTPAPATSLRARLQAYEVRVLTEAYLAARGNISQMARDLAVDRSTLHLKLRSLALYTPRSGHNARPSGPYKAPRSA